jgi:PII-like signaling protein
MQIPEDAVLLRIFIGESDRWEHKPLYEAIVLKAREMHLGGATVLRGPMGFGKTSRLHTAKILNLSTDLPLVIEIVDCEEDINAFLPVLDKMITGGLVTIEKVKVLHYRGATKEAKPA